MARKRAAERATPKPRAIILQFEPFKYAVAVWRRDEDGEAVYEILHENMRHASVAATLAREATNEDRG
jgi:hypothetical protein